MLLYYTQRVKDPKITSILNEATNKYIENMKEKFRLQQLYEKNDEQDIIPNNNGLLLFVSFVSFICGYSCGRKCIQ